MYLAGIDIGTTGCKCSVYSDLGEFIDEAYVEYRCNISKQEHTINADMVWNNVKSVLNKIATSVKEIEAISVTSFGEASVLLDEKDTPLAEAYLFSDPNGEKECREIEEVVGRDYIYENMGLIPGKMYSACKWKWHKKKENKLWEKGKYICLFEDYIVYKLSGIRQIDYSLAARTMAFNVHKLCWDSTILEFLGVDESMLSKPVPMGTAAGKMKKEIQKELGFSNQPFIVSGCHDQIAAAIGSGALHANQGVDGTGTVECITAIYSKQDKINMQKMFRSGYAIVPYRKDLYASFAFSYTGGALLKWYRDQLASYEASEIKENGQDPYEVFNEQIDEGYPSGLLVLPYFAGAGTPYMDSKATGAILGLTLETTKAQIYQALMEGASFEMRLNLERLEQAGIIINELMATGGGANSKKWLQIKADIMNKKIVSFGGVQTGTLACIMLAGVACNRYGSLEEARRMFDHKREVYYPRQQTKEEYNLLYKKYKQLYPSLFKKGKKK